MPKFNHYALRMLATGKMPFNFSNIWKEAFKTRAWICCHNEYNFGLLFYSYLNIVYATLMFDCYHTWFEQNLNSVISFTLIHLIDMFHSWKNNL